MIYIHCIDTVDISELRYICCRQIYCVLSLAPESLLKADSDAPDLPDQQLGVALQNNNVRRLLQSEMQKLLSYKVFKLQKCGANGIRTPPSLILSLQKGRACLALVFESDFEKCLWLRPRVRTMTSAISKTSGKRLKVGLRL